MNKSTLLWQFKLWLKRTYKNNFKINFCCKKLIVYDENAISGGIFPVIQKILNEYNVKRELIPLCSPDKQIFKYLQSREAILKILGLTKSDLNKII